MTNANLYARRVVRLLNKQYPAVVCPLAHGSTFQLLVAVILSAQCTDAQVNKITPVLFTHFPTAEKMAAGSLRAIEKYIHSTGFYRSKAKYLKSASAMVVRDFGGRVPKTMIELLRLPGVARKTANVVLSVAFGRDVGVVVDTHVIRLSWRLGLTNERAPEKIERDLMRVLPKRAWGRVPLQMIYLGREFCTARKPRCVNCPLSKICPSAFTVPREMF